MPIRKKRIGKKRRFRRRRNFRKKGAIVKKQTRNMLRTYFPGIEPPVKNIRGIGSGPFPERIRVTLPYWENLRIHDTAGATNYDEYHYCVNSLFDPNESGGSHQPRGFDQWATYYGNYIVHNFRYEIEVYAPYQTSKANSMIIGCIFGPALEDLNWSTLQDVMEYPHLKKFVKTQRIVAMGVNSSQINTMMRDKAVFKGNMNIIKLINSTGMANRTSSVTYQYPVDYAAAVTANPTAKPQVSIVMASLLDTGTSLINMPDVYINAKLYFDAEFYNLLQPNAS